MTIQFTRWSWASWLLKGLGQRWLYHTAHHRLFLRGLGELCQISSENRVSNIWWFISSSSFYHIFSAVDTFLDQTESQAPCKSPRTVKKSQEVCSSAKTHPHTLRYVYIYTISNGVYLWLLMHVYRVSCMWDIIQIHQQMLDVQCVYS